MRRMILFVALAVGVTVSGCGSSSKGSTATSPTASAGSSTTLSLASYRQDYLSIIDPIDTTATRFSASEKALGNGTGDATGEQVVAVAQPFIAALKKGDRQLLAVQWPSTTETDVRTLVSDDQAVIGDLQGFADATTATAASMEAQLTKDANDDRSANLQIRSDLGLPQQS